MLRLCSIPHARSCYFSLLCIHPVLGTIFCCIHNCKGDMYRYTGCGENEYCQKLRANGSAHSLILTSDAIVYERKAHVTEQMVNLATFDQYGHRFPACVQREVSVPPMKLSIPIGRAEVVVLPRKNIIAVPYGAEFTWNCWKSCVDYEPKGDVVAVKVGDGVKVVVACLECGANSNAAAFIDACKSARAKAPRESPELSAAFGSWFLDLMRRTGRMTGAAPTNYGFDQPWPQSLSGLATPFVKTIAPLPASLGPSRTTGWGQKRAQSSALNAEVTDDGTILKPKTSPYVDQLNAGDRLVAIGGVQRPEGGTIDTWLQQPSSAGIHVESTMPYFQPNALGTISLPSGASVAELGLERNSSKPPKMSAQPQPLAQSFGLQPNDIVVQASIDGASIDVTSLTADQLCDQAAASAGAVSLTVLQVTQTTMGKHAITWPVQARGP